MTKEGINTPSDVALIVGMVFFVFGFIFLAWGTVIPLFQGMFIWGALILVLGIGVLVAGIILKTKEKTPSISPQSNVITKEKETIIKEVVMVPCQYCGNLIPQASIFCPHCGAKRKG